MSRRGVDTDRGARERLLAAANELFDKEGVHTVGIDRIIERAGLAKATLYSAFGSKDGLIRAYLARRYEVWKRRLPERLSRYDTPRDRLLGVFDYLAEVVAHPAFNGCAFMNAAAEDRPGGPAEEPSRAYRDSVRSLFTELAQAAGRATPSIWPVSSPSSTTELRSPPGWTKAPALESPPGR